MASLAELSLRDNSGRSTPPASVGSHGGGRSSPPTHVAIAAAVAGIPKLDRLSKSDPFVVLRTREVDADAAVGWREVDRTETVWNSHECEMGNVLMLPLAQPSAASTPHLRSPPRTPPVTGSPGTPPRRPSSLRSPGAGWFGPASTAGSGSPGGSGGDRGLRGGAVPGRTILRFEVYDRDGPSQSLGFHTKVGSLEIPLSDLMTPTRGGGSGVHVVCTLLPPVGRKAAAPGSVGALRLAAERVWARPSDKISLHMVVRGPWAKWSKPALYIEVARAFCPPVPHTPSSADGGWTSGGSSGGSEGGGGGVVARAAAAAAAMGIPVAGTGAGARAAPTLPADASEIVTVFRSSRLDAAGAHSRVTSAKRFHAALVPLEAMLGSASGRLPTSSTATLRPSELPDVALRLALLVRDHHRHKHEMLRPLGHINTSLRALLSNPSITLVPLEGGGSAAGGFPYGPQDQEWKLGADDITGEELAVAMDSFLVSSPVQ
ncbi:hypothetical protein MMPV_009036 [Pyropia vietnamensis]